MFGGVNPDKIRTKLGLPENSSVSDVRKELIKQGYDGVIVHQITDEGVIKNIEVVGLNPEQIKTKSQLTNIWNKANKK